MKLTTIPITSILIGKRFREELGDIKGLAESMKSKGIITPIAVSSGPENVYHLLAGGRRIVAAELAGITEIPVRIYERELTELELRSIELEENIQRKDLEWWEKVNLQKEINDLQQQIHGQKFSTAEDATGWSMRDTASLMGKSIGGISMDIKLAETMKEMPELEWDKCKNKSDAVKLMSKVEEAFIRQELSKRAEDVISTGGQNAARKRLMDSYIVRDYLEAVKDLEAGMFNLVEIDPPYSIDLGKMKKEDGISKYDYGKEGYNEIRESDYINFIHEVLCETYHVMAENSWLLLWFAPEPWFTVMFELLIDVGFNLNRMPAIWVKGEEDDKLVVDHITGQTMHPQTHLANSYEMFFWARKGNPPLAKPGSTNSFPYRPVPPQKKIHPTERPLDLMLDILSTFAFENSTVLVPFAGSGNTLVAAHQLKMHPVGFDLSQQFKDAFNIRCMSM